jgi:two-component system LytT family response regulator
MIIRTLIVDDEPLARRRVQQLLKGRADFTVVGEAENGRDALEKIGRAKPELIFLDAQMPEMDGFEMLRRIPAEQLPVVIFVTAYDQFALRAFESHALDYLLKPIGETQFAAALERAKTYLSGRRAAGLDGRIAELLKSMASPRAASGRMMVDAGGRTVVFKLADLSWIEAEGNYVRLHVNGESYLVRGRLREFQKRLDAAVFFQIHRSTIVNLDRVVEFRPLFKGEGVVVLADGTKLAASRSCSARLQATLRVTL